MTSDQPHRNPMHRLPHCLRAAFLCCVAAPGLAAPPQSDDGITQGAASANLQIVPTTGFYGSLPGARIRTQVFLSNRGPDTATDVSFEASLPDGLEFVSLDLLPEIACETPAVGESGTISCTRPEIAWPGSQHVDIEFEVGEVPVGTLLRADLAVSAETPDPDLEDNVFAVDVLVRSGSEQADLGLQVHASPNPVAPGGQLTYTFVVTNHGPDDAVGAGFNATIPIGFAGGSETLPEGWTCTALPPHIGVPPPSQINIVCRTPLMAVGSATTMFQLNVAPTTSGSLTLTANTVSTTSDSNASNNSAAVTVIAGFASPSLIPVLSPGLLAGLALVLVMVGLWASSRRS